MKKATITLSLLLVAMLAACEAPGFLQTGPAPSPSPGAAGGAAKAPNVSVYFR